MKKNKYILKINQQFNQRKSMLYFLLILAGTIFPSISGSNYFNFWYRLYHILSSPTFNAFLYLAISLNFIYYIGDAFKNYQLINRYASYLEVVKYFLEDMIIFTIYLLFIALIVSIGGAFIFCLGLAMPQLNPYLGVRVLAEAASADLATAASPALCTQSIAKAENLTLYDARFVVYKNVDFNDAKCRNAALLVGRSTLRKQPDLSAVLTARGGYYIGDNIYVPAPRRN